MKLTNNRMIRTDKRAKRAGKTIFRERDKKRDHEDKCPPGFLGKCVGSNHLREKLNDGEINGLDGNEVSYRVSNPFGFVGIKFIEQNIFANVCRQLSFSISCRQQRRGSCFRDHHSITLI